MKRSRLLKLQLPEFQNACLLIVSSLALLSHGFVSADPMAIYEIESSDGIYLETDLDREIYRYSLDSDLRDLMVVDVDGRELPSRVVTLQAELTETNEPFPLSFFPVLAGEDPAVWLSRRGAELCIDEDAISLRLDPNNRAPQNAAVDFYIIDISSLDQALDRLEVDWAAEQSTRVVAVDVSASRDLQQWNRLTQETLAQLSKEGESLLRNTVKLSVKPEQYRYLRLRFLHDASVNVQSLRGHRIIRHVDGPPPQRWEVSGTFAEEQRPVQSNNSRQSAASNKRATIAAWEFQRNERAPANHISIALGDAGYGERVQIFSRDNPRQAWQLRHTGIWFNTKVGDQWQQSEAISLRPNTDLFWRLELNNSAAERTQPRLVFEHPQQRLQFVANNNPPYYIAIAEQVPTQRAATQVLTRVVDDRQVSWEAIGKQKMDSAQPADISVGFNWQAVLFWFVLGVAVVILMVFAIRLLRQMENTR